MPPLQQMVLCVQLVPLIEQGGSPGGQVLAPAAPEEIQVVSEAIPATIDSLSSFFIAVPLCRTTDTNWERLRSGRIGLGCAAPQYLMYMIHEFLR